MPKSFNFWKTVNEVDSEESDESDGYKAVTVEDEHTNHKSI